MIKQNTYIRTIVLVALMTLGWTHNLMGAGFVGTIASKVGDSAASRAGTLIGKGATEAESRTLVNAADKALAQGASEAERLASKQQAAGLEASISIAKSATNLREINLKGSETLREKPVSGAGVPSTTRPVSEPEYDVFPMSTKGSLSRADSDAGYMMSRQMGSRPVSQEIYASAVNKTEITTALGRSQKPGFWKQVDNALRKVGTTDQTKVVDAKGAREAVVAQKFLLDAKLSKNYVRDGDAMIASKGEGKFTVDGTISKDMVFTKAEKGPDGNFYLITGNGQPYKIGQPAQGTKTRGTTTKSDESQVTTVATKYEISNNDIISSLVQRINNGEKVVIGKGSEVKVGSGPFKIAKAPESSVSQEGLISAQAVSKVKEDARLNAQGPITTAFRATKNGIVTAVSYTWKGAKFVGMILVQAMAFTVPTMMMQMEEQAKQREAVIETVSDVQPFGNLFMQIPPQLVNHYDASASKFYYAEVPTDKKHPLSYFTDDFLRQANYYVAFAGNYVPWASIWIGNPSFTGQMVHLNSGWLFEGAVSVDQSQPTFPLRPTGSIQSQNPTVESYVNQFAASVGNAVTFKASLSGSFGITDVLHSNSISLPHVMSDLFITGTQTTSKLVGASGFTPPPPLFSKAISAMRAKRYLPNFGNIALRQARGTGFLNNLLSPDIDWSNQTLNDAVTAYNTARIAYDVAAGNQTALTQAETALLQAEDAVSVALKGTSLRRSGLFNEENINLYNIYVYEISTDSGDVVTPSLNFLLQNKAHSVLPVTEYVACLDSAGNVIPLIIPSIVKKDTTYTVDYILNPSLTYITSLTTGMTYASNGTGQLGLPLMQHDGMTPDTSFALNALAGQSTTNAILTGITKVGANSPSIKAIANQIIDMSNYVAHNAIAGPFTLTNGYQFEEVPLPAILTAESQKTSLTAPGSVAQVTQQDVDTMTAVLSGVASWSGATFAPEIKQLQSLALPNVHIYKVSIPGINGSPTIGALSYLNAQGKMVDIPDYVVAVTPSSDGQTQTILPLGLSGISGSPMPGNTQFIISLITGCIYDSNYNLLPPSITTKVIDRSYVNYMPTGGDTASQIKALNVSTKNWPTVLSTYVDPVSGQLTQAQLPYLQTSLSTGYMPTAFNPNNIVFINAADKQTYMTNLANLSTAQSAQTLAAQQVNKALLVNPTAPIPAAILALYQTDVSNFATSLVSQYSGVSAGVAQNVKSALDAYTSATSTYNSMLQIYSSFQAKIDSGVVQTVSAGVDELLEIPPLYFLYFSRFSYANDGGVTAQDLGVGGQNKLTWIDAQASTTSTPIATAGASSITPIPLANILPITFLGFDVNDPTNYKTTSAGAPSFPSLLNTYYAWSSSESSKYWAQSALVGPFNFTGSAMAQSDRANQNNVFLTATSRADVTNGNFFYRATGFDSTDLFVVGHTADLNTPVTSIADLKDLGKPFVQPGGPNWYMVNMSTGYVYTPYITGVDIVTTDTSGNPVSVPSTGTSLSGVRVLYTKDSLGYPVNECLAGTPSTAKWWSLVQAGKEISIAGTSIIKPLVLNPVDVLNAVLKNTVSNGQQATFSSLTPSLQALLTSIQSVAKQTIQRSLYPFYFNNQFTLRLRQDQIDNGSYVYAVVNKGESYLGASDYLVACAINSDAILEILPGAITQNTQSMISVVTGTVYGVIPVTEWYVAEGITLPETPMHIKQSLPVVASDLSSAINTLNTLYIKGKQKAQAAGAVATMPMLDVATLKLYTKDASSRYSKLYTSNASGKTKYFLQSETLGIYGVKATDGTITQTTGMVTSYFDFKVTQTGLAQDQTTDYGVSYNVDPRTGKVSVGRTLTGFMLQAARRFSGVYVNTDGTQTLGIPVQDMYLPKGDAETNLIPEFGQSGQYMNYFNQYGIVSDVTHNALYTYYQNTAVAGLFAGVQDQGVPVTDPKFMSKTAKTSQIVKSPDKFVNLLTGDAYDVTGAPFLQPVTMAFKHLTRRANIETLPGIKAAKLPLAALQAATPVTSGSNTATDNLYLVTGKYYYKEVTYGPTIDIYGNTQNDSNGNQNFDQITRYFDFNGSASVAAPTSDTGMGIWYQITTDSSNNQLAVPIDNTWNDDPNDMDSQFLTDIRDCYGVMVDSKGIQTLVAPIVNGVDYTRSFFIWGDENAFDETYSISVMYHDGTSYNVYNYVPYSRVYKFTSPDGNALYDYAYVPQGGSTSDLQAQVQVTTTDLATSTPVQTVVTLDTKTLMGDALQAAIAKGYILYATKYDVGIGIDVVSIDETMITPKTYTILNDNTEYIQILPNVNYTTAWKRSAADKDTDIAILQKIGNILVKGTPFVATIIGGRAQGSQDAPELNGGPTYLVGIQDPINSGLFAVISDGFDQDGNVSTQYCITPGLDKSTPMPGTLIEYDSAFGTQVYAMTSNYPVLTNPIDGSLLNQGYYVTLQYDGTNEYLYKYVNQLVSDKQLNAMVSTVNIVSNVDGTSTLAGSFMTGDLVGISGVSGAMAGNLFFVSSPDQRVLYKVPSTAQAKAYYITDTTKYTDGSGNSIDAITNFANSVGTYPAGSYIDYTTGVIFTQSLTDPKTFYPLGNSLDASSLILIHEQFNNAVVQWNQGVPALVTPDQLVSSTLTPGTAAAAQKTAAANAVKTTTSVATTAKTTTIKPKAIFNK